MAKLEFIVDMAAPPDRVFAFFVPQRMPYWYGAEMESRFEVQRGAAEFAVGLKVRITGRLGRKEVSHTAVVTRHDWGRLLEYLSRGREVVRASAYAPISDDPMQPLSEQRFVQPFVGRGYRIVTKPLKRFADGSIKANFDVELAIDILTMSDRLDVVSLVSGDGDFLRLVELVASKGVRVEVVAFPEITAAELRAVADDYIDLAAHMANFQAI